MWFLYATIHVFLMALVNYIDEYLTTNNKVPESSNIHVKIGGLLLISTLLSGIGMFFIWVFVRDVGLAPMPLMLGLISAVPMVVMYAVYFYLLTTYPAYQVVPLFLISSLWLFVIELLSGERITLMGFLGIAALLVGAYFLDTGTLKWQIPTKLLLISIPATSAWAVALFLVRIASQNNSAIVITFWQYAGIIVIGIFLLLFVKKYREGLFYRIEHQGKNFLGFSLLNESLSQSSYVFGNLAVAVAPVATFVTAMSGVQSVFLLLLFLFFPIHKNRAKVTKLQIIAILLIALGVFLIEGVRKP